MKKRQAVVIFFAILCLAFETKSQLVKKGNEAYKEKRYQTALENYQKAQIKNPDSPVIRFNSADALYELNEYRDAERAYEKVNSRRSLETEDKTLLAKSLYNYGNVQYRLGQFDKAMDAYKKVLDLTPDDADAKYNLELLQEMKKAFDKKHSERQKQNKDQQQQQPKQQQQQQNQDQQGGGGQEQQQDKSQGQGEGEQDKQNQEQKQDQQGQGEQNQDKKDQKQDESQEQQKSGEKDQPQDESQKQDADAEKQQGEPQEQEKDKEQQGQEEEKQEQEPAQGQELTPYELSQLEQQQPPPSQNQTESQQDSPQSGDQSPQGANAPPTSKISKQQAMQILNALYESEKEVLNMRRPPAKPHDKTVTKDW